VLVSYLDSFESRKPHENTFGPQTQALMRIIPFDHSFGGMVLSVVPGKATEERSTGFFDLVARFSLAQNLHRSGNYPTVIHIADCDLEAVDRENFIQVGHSTQL